MPSEGKCSKPITNPTTTYYPVSSYVKEVDGTTTIRKTYSTGRKQLPKKSFSEAPQHSRSVAEGSGTSIAVRTIINGTQNTLNWLLSDHTSAGSVEPWVRLPLQPQRTVASGFDIIFKSSREALPKCNAGSTWFSELRYSAFGETRYSSGITATDYRYTGQLQQADINLYYYNARYYDPALGRFVQSDTMVPEPGSIQSYDRYAYVINNPIKYNDPSGHCYNYSTPEAAARCNAYWASYSQTAKTNPAKLANSVPKKAFAPRSPSSFVVAGGTVSDKVDNAAALPGTPVGQALPKWDTTNNYNLKHYDHVDYLGNKTDDAGIVTTAKYRQMTDLEKLALDVDVAIIGYSGGGDSALMYAKKHQVAGLVLLDPTGSGSLTGKVNPLPSDSLEYDSTVALINKLASEQGVRIVLVDDSGRFKDANFTNQNILYIASSSDRPHYAENGTGTNGNTALIARAWNFLMTGKDY